MMSTALPGDDAAIIRIGRDGYCCAIDGQALDDNITIDDAASVDLFTFIPRYVFLATHLQVKGRVETRSKTVCWGKTRYHYHINVRAVRGCIFVFARHVVTGGYKVLQRFHNAGNNMMELNIAGLFEPCTQFSPHAGGMT